MHVFLGPRQDVDVVWEDIDVGSDESYEILSLQHW